MTEFTKGDRVRYKGPGGTTWEGRVLRVSPTSGNVQCQPDPRMPLVQGVEPQLLEPVAEASERHQPSDSCYSAFHQPVCRLCGGTERDSLSREAFWEQEQCPGRLSPNWTRSADLESPSVLLGQRRLSGAKGP